MHTSKNTNHIETSQSNCLINQLTNSHTTQASTERYLQTDFDETCQSIKKQRRIQNTVKHLRQRPLQKTVNSLNPLINFAKSSILDTWLGFK